MGCGRIRDSEHECTPDKSAAIIWCDCVSIDQNLKGMFLTHYIENLTIYLKNLRAKEGSVPKYRFIKHLFMYVLWKSMFGLFIWHVFGLFMVLPGSHFPNGAPSLIKFVYYMTHLNTHFWLVIYGIPQSVIFVQ